MVHREGVGIHCDGIEKALRAFIKGTEQLFAKPTLLRRFLEQHIVVIGNAELLGKHGADLAPAAAVLSANRNDHSDSSFFSALKQIKQKWC